MQLIKGRAIAVDEWRYVDDEAPLQDPAPILSLEHFQRERTHVIERSRPVGLRLTVEDALEDIVDDLKYFDLIALEFPVFTDGRHYSNAQLLRERYGYQGDIRATGDVLQDQLLFMRRCGFSSFELQSAGDNNLLNAFDEFSVFYQQPASAPNLLNSTQAH